MKKNFMFFILLLSVFVFVGCKDLDSPLHQELRNFEKAKAARMEITINNGIYYKKGYDCAFTGDLVEFTYPNRQYERVIYDVRNGIEYYEGYECSYSAKNKRIIDSRALVLEKYMSKFSYEEGAASSYITAKFNIIKMVKDSVDFDLFDNDLYQIRKVYTDCWIKIFFKEGKVKEIKIYPNYDEYEYTYISYQIYEYGDQINRDITLKDNYEEFSNYDKFLEAIEEDRNFSLYPDVSLNGHYIELNKKVFVFSTTAKKHEISFHVGELGAGIVGDVYDTEEVDLKEHFKDIDFSVPGTYEKLFVYEYEGEKLADFITIHIVEESEIKATKFADDMPNSQEQFFFDNYLGLAYKITLYLYDLDDISEKHTFNIVGLYSSYYAKDNYLYVAGYEKVNENGNEEDYISYITKINVDTFEIEKQFTIDRYVSNMVVDKYDNIIFSKGNGEHVTFEMYNASKDKLEFIGNDDSTDYSKNAILSYDKENEIIRYINNNSETKVFEYDSSINNYKYVNKVSVGSFSLIEYVKDSQIIFSQYYYDFNEKKQYYFLSLKDTYTNTFTGNSGTINEGLVIIGSRSNNKNYSLAVIDTETYSQANVTITGINLYTELISKIHYYNGKIYLYDKIDKKVWVAEYK